jgi:feruloyl esterase
MPPRSAASVCAALSGRSIAAVSLTTTIVPASAAAPTYCKVTGVIDEGFRFEMRLPEDWNGKLYYGGGGGYDGVMPPLVLPALQQGYVQVVSNGGHVDTGDGMSAAFIENNPRAAELFGSQSVPAVMAVAVPIIREAYGAPPTRSYFEGCSTGGREALMAVQRNPELFDGVIARAPAFNWVGFMGQFNGVSRALAAPGGAFSAAKATLLAQHVRDACDGLDGVRDGIVSNRQACTTRVVNIASLRCAGGGDLGDSCLSDAQLAVVRTWTSDVSYAGGAYRSRGYPLTGNEDDPMNFGIWASGNGDVRTAGQYIMQDSTLRYYLARDAHVDSLTYAPWDQNRGALDRMAALNDATQTDIRPFIRRGGKLIVWQGASDAALSVNSTVDYVTTMQRTVGRANAAASTRFYVAPGVNHCTGGVGADETDLLSALDHWVTSGSAPSALLATKRDETGAVGFTRPLCVYPQYPRYIGPPNDAAAARSASNYVCTASQ